MVVIFDNIVLLYLFVVFVNCAIVHIKKYYYEIIYSMCTYRNIIDHNCVNAIVFGNDILITFIKSVPMMVLFYIITIYVMVRVCYGLLHRVFCN